MSRFPFPRLSKSRQLLALLCALALTGAACSGSSDVDVDDASGSTDTTAAGDEAESEESVADESADDPDEVAAEAEDDAMGEDDAMVDDEVETTAPANDDSSGTSSAASDLGSAELTAAFEASTGDRFSLPFMYLTVDQDCSGCAETMSLYYVPSEAKASILTLSAAYIDGVVQSDFSAVDPSLVAGDPRRIAEQLTGTDAEFGVDTVSGAVTSWTLDGNSVTLRCVQVDTRPVDMRTEICENSIIG